MWAEAPPSNTALHRSPPLYQVSHSVHWTRVCGTERYAPDDVCVLARLVAARCVLHYTHTPGSQEPGAGDTIICCALKVHETAWAVGNTLATENLKPHAQDQTHYLTPTPPLAHHCQRLPLQPGPGGGLRSRPRPPRPHPRPRLSTTFATGHHHPTSVGWWRLHRGGWLRG